jgi:polysaccharide biosynthesis/export protein
MRTLLAFLFLLAAAFAQGGEFPLRSGEKINISIGGVWGTEVAQIKGVYTIGDNGTINLLHIGEVRASGLTPSKLQRAIEQAYVAAEIYVRPNVLVSVDDAVCLRPVYVTGVQKPGVVPFRQGMTLSQAVQFAGGPTAFTSMRHVRLIRLNKTTDHNLATGMGNPDIDVVLQPDDQIHLID